MELELRRVEPSYRVWDQREEFLLLPGDGLILVSGEGRLRFFDTRARLLLGPASKDCCGEPMEGVWPELAELLEHFTVTVREKGPIDTNATYHGRAQAGCTTEEIKPRASICRVVTPCRSSTLAIDLRQWGSKRSR